LAQPRPARHPADRHGHRHCGFLVWCGVADESEQRATPERRVETRSPIELKVEYKRLNTFFADYTKNISRGGTFIKTSRPLPIGTEFLFKLFVPGRDEPFTIHGEVQRIIDAGTAEEPGMAIKFVYREGDPQ